MLGLLLALLADVSETPMVLAWERVWVVLLEPMRALQTGSPTEHLWGVQLALVLALTLVPWLVTVLARVTADPWALPMEPQLEERLASGLA
jgi:hypothetical protein